MRLKIEIYEKWSNVGGINAAAGGAVLIENKDGLTLQLFVKRQILVIYFKRFLALSIHEEFAHPRFDLEEDSAIPRVEERYVFPCLIVKNSYWLDSFSESRLAPFDRRELIHYRFVTLSNTYDVLAVQEPLVNWLEDKSSVSANFHSEADRRFFEQLNPEDGPEKCAITACENYRIALSRRCRVHHFEMIRGYHLEIESPSLSSDN